MKTWLLNHKQVVRKVMFLVSVVAALGGGTYGTYRYLQRHDYFVFVKTFTPQGVVSATSNIVVEFSRPMVTLETLGKELTDPFIEFNPPLKGTYRWVYPDTLTFYPSKPFAPATRYEAKITSQVNSQKKAWFIKQRSFSFETDPLHVQTISVSVNPVEKDLKGVVRLWMYFNYPVDPKEVGKRLSLTYANPNKAPLAFKVMSGEADKTLIFESDPIDRSKEKTELTVFLRNGLTSSLGGRSIENNYQETRIIDPLETLKFQSAKPAQKVDVPVIELSFSQPVEPSTIARYLDVKPTMKFEVVPVSETVVHVLGHFDPGKNYKMTLKKGLPGKYSFPLESEVVSVIPFEDLAPYLSFTHGGVYLPRHGDYNLSLTTVNVPALRVRIEKVFTNNLFHFLRFGLNRNEYYDNGDDYSDGYGDEAGGDYEEEYGYDPSANGESEWGFSKSDSFSKEVYSQVVQMKTEKNKKVESLLALKPFLDTQEDGFYIMTITPDKENWKKISKWLVVTDIGVIAKKSSEKLMVMAHGFSDLEPIADADVTLISSNNQEMAKAKTDKTGVAVIENMRGLEKQFTPSMVKVQKGKDISFLQLEKDETSLTDFDTGGIDSLVQGYEAFIYADRDLYRPGEQAHVVGYVRAPGMAVPKSFPLTFKVLNPQGGKVTEKVVTLNEYGSFETDISLPHESETGSYEASLEISKATIGSYTFNVEDFMPLRTKIDLKLDKKAYVPEETVTVDIKAANLFGPPAVDRKTKAHLEMTRSVYESKKFPEFSFENVLAKFEKIDEDLGEGITDDKGEGEFSYQIPKEIKAVPKLSGKILAEVSEAGGGRMIGANDFFDVYPQPHLVGIRVMPDPVQEIDQGNDAKRVFKKSFQFIVTDNQDKVVPDVPLTSKLYKREWKSILRKDSNGRLTYVSEYEDKEVASLDFASAKAPVEKSFTLKDYGSYRIETTSDKEVVSSSLFSYYGWGVASWSMAQPNHVTFKLDKDVYRLGDEAVLNVQAPFSGLLMLTWESHDIVHYESHVIEGNTATIKLPIKEEALPNTYLIGVLIRSAKSLEKNAPAIAVGATPLKIDSSARKLNIAIDAVDTMRSKSDLDVNFSIEGGGKGQWTLAAVDEGILQITAYTTPNPLDFFFQKRRLEVSTYDAYSNLLPELSGAGIPLKVGGDEGRVKNLNAISVKRVKPVALWSGTVQTDSSGKGHVTLHVPEFNGALRLMAVASQKDYFGSTDKKVLVRDPIVMSPQIPRVIAPDDEFKVPVEIYNGTPSAGKVKVSLSIEGDVSIVGKKEMMVDIPKDQQRTTEFSLKAGHKVGPVYMKLLAEKDEEHAESNTELALRPVSPPVIVSGAGSLKSGEAVKIEWPKNFIPGTTKAFVEVSGLPQVQWKKNLLYLLEYPYGCLEQTVSRLFPMLYFRDVAKRSIPEFSDDTSIDYFMNEGLQKVAALQNRNEGFSYWPGQRPSRYYSWTSLYACHFFAEAANKGYAVKPDALSTCEDYLHSIARADHEYFKDYFQNPSTILENRVYASLILALMGKGDRNQLLYLKEAEKVNLSSVSRYQLAEAFALVGDQRSAGELLPAKLQMPTGERQSNGNFYSPIKAKAIMLEAMQLISPGSSNVAAIVRDLIQNNKDNNTQENSYSLMAIGKVYAQTPPAHFKGVMNTGEKEVSFTEAGMKWNSKEAGQASFSKDFSLKMEGEGQGYYYWRMEGLQEGNFLKESDAGLIVRRRYLDDKGKEIDMKNIHQGDFLIAEVTLENADENQGNFAVVDILPSGFEIENPRLGSKNPMDWMPEPKLEPDYVDIRDDRLIFFARYLPKKVTHYYYGLRAVTKGQFVVPPIHGESMYRPDIQSLASGGSVVIQ